MVLESVPAPRYEGAPPMSEAEDPAEPALEARLPSAGEGMTRHTGAATGAAEMEAHARSPHTVIRFLIPSARAREYREDPASLVRAVDDREGGRPVDRNRDGAADLMCRTAMSATQVSVPRASGAHTAAVVRRCCCADADRQSS